MSFILQLYEQRNATQKHFTIQFINNHDHGDFEIAVECKATNAEVTCFERTQHRSYIKQ